MLFQSYWRLRDRYCNICRRVFISFGVLLFYLELQFELQRQFLVLPMFLNIWKEQSLGLHSQHESQRLLNVYIGLKVRMSNNLKITRLPFSVVHITNLKLDKYIHRVYRMFVRYSNSGHLHVFLTI